MGVVIRRWVWLETIGVASGCFPHITYISLLLLYLLFFAAASLLLFSFCYIYIYSGGERSDAVVRLKRLWTIDSCHYNNIIIPNTLIAIIIIII